MCHGLACALAAALLHPPPCALPPAGRDDGRVVGILTLATPELDEASGNVTFKDVTLLGDFSRFRWGRGGAAAGRVRHAHSSHHCSQQPKMHRPGRDRAGPAAAAAAAGCCTRWRGWRT